MAGATIDIHTKVSVVLLGGIFSVLGLGTWTTARAYGRIESRLESIEQDIAEQGLNRWMDSDMVFWAQELQLKNPTLIVPTPRRLTSRQ